MSETSRSQQWLPTHSSLSCGHLRLEIVIVLVTHRFGTSISCYYPLHGSVKQLLKTMVKHCMLGNWFEEWSTETREDVVLQILKGMFLISWGVLVSLKFY